MLNNETVGRPTSLGALSWRWIDVHTVPGNHEAYIRQYVRIAGENCALLKYASSKNLSREVNGAWISFEPKNIARFDM
jgi:hypothetical protein